MQKIILCQSTRVMHRPVALAQVGTCSDCKIGVWLAPSSVRLFKADSDVKPLCEQCAKAFFESASSPMIFGIAPGAMQEAMVELMKVSNN